MKIKKFLKSKYFWSLAFLIAFIAAVLVAAHFMTGETSIVKVNNIDSLSEDFNDTQYDYFYMEKDGSQFLIKCTKNQISYLTNTRLYSDNEENEAQLYQYELQVRTYKFPAKKGKLLQIVDREKISKNQSD